MSDTTLVAYLSIDGEPGWCAFDLSDETQTKYLLEEINNLMTGSLMPGHVDSDEDTAFVTIGIRQKPTGYVATLPEFEGW